MNKPFTIREASWGADMRSLKLIRETVFIKEQHVPVELEWDEHDSECIHLLAINDSGEPIGTARMLSDGHIGRIAVMPEWRRQGVGSAMLLRLVEMARLQSLPKVILYAQTVAIPFYQQHHFEIISDEFMDAGIPHRAMSLQLN